MKKIPLTKGQFALVDDEDYEWLSRWKWSLEEGNCGHRYASRKERVSHTERVRKLMHRVIMNAPSGLMVDHKDRNGLNNSRANLRLCSRSQNAVNTENRGRGRWKLKGVYKNRARFRARIEVDKKRISLGSFETLGEAAQAYNKAAKQYFGEFAVLNNA